MSGAPPGRNYAWATGFPLFFRFPFDVFLRLFMKIRTLVLLPLLVIAALFTGIVLAATSTEATATQAKKKKKKKASPKTTVTVYSAKTVSTKVVPQSLRTVNAVSVSPKT